jgi:hypothetical protein
MRNPITPRERVELLYMQINSRVLYRKTLAQASLEGTIGRDIINALLLWEIDVAEAQTTSQRPTRGIVAQRTRPRVTVAPKPALKQCTISNFLGVPIEGCGSRNNYLDPLAIVG